LPDGLLVGFAFKSNSTGFGGPGALATFNLRVVNMRQQWDFIAWVEHRSAGRAFFEMSGPIRSRIPPGSNRIDLELRPHGTV
jgi:hypothetical protein